MIVLTLAGDSRRFFDLGFTQVKYKLEYNDVSIIENILGYIPRNFKLLLILNSKFNDFNYFEDLLIRMQFSKFKIVEIDASKGQFDTLLKGLEISKNFYKRNESLTIFNGDTIRKTNKWDGFECDGYIEVFKGEGDHWSFVDNLGPVALVKEKQRISDFCSSGLYYFKTIDLIYDHKESYFINCVGELYISPYYNYLINSGKLIISGFIEESELVFCGTPVEYKSSLSRLNK